MNKIIKIKNTLIGEGYPAYIIAEMSANHGGDINRAIEIIHAAKEAGANCIKIQTYTADTLTIDSDKEYFQIKKGTWKGESLYSLYKKAYTPWEWQGKLKEEAEKAGIDFLSTPFDKTAIDFLEDLGVDFYKIASFELVDIPLIKYVASKGKPIIMSTGMGTLGEIEEAVNTVKSQGNNDLCLLKCSSAYPAIPDDMNLKTIKNLEETFGVPAGLSDHSLGSVAAVTAVAIGAKVIEKHFCLSRKVESADASFSMEPQEFKQMVQDIRAAEKAMGRISYEVSEREKISRAFRKSIFVVKNIKKGEILTEENIRIIRPANGLEPKYFPDVLGKKAVKDIERGTPLEWSMIE
ncbi:Pseudaminic acid synthase [Koleobacter methoxysyntrophicus]|uniref:Pseudaminic acid synthase n=1 Tax=Koleobacter methoxysyntrophicus TaxID=2751313 RepID=A0A8A0RSC1_9FIRM|nr:pseudaminic acid synthase [Koleobacter methoxysyntrophicus]QSQ10398.1 Pseudaminic acid synthase [Koleobacter methoxysyntrophicus]